MADIKKMLPVIPSGQDPAGIERIVLTSEEGHLAINGLYNAVTNTDPSQIGLVTHTRAATPADSDQIIRVTGGTPADNLANADIHTQDVSSFLMGYDSGTSQWDRVTITSGALDVNISSGNLSVDLDGEYVLATNPTPDSVGTLIHSRSAAPDETNQTFRPTGIQGAVDSSIHAADVSLHDQNGDAFTPGNPLSVSVVDNVAGLDVMDYNDNAGVDIAAGASINHDYTVTAAKTLILKQVQGSASSRARFELQIETGVATAVFTTKAVFFVSEATHNFSETFANPIDIAAGIKVRVVKENRDDDDGQVIYSYISGIEV